MSRHRDMENHTEVDRPMMYLTYAREWYQPTDHRRPRTRQSVHGGTVAADPVWTDE